MHIVGKLQASEERMMNETAVANRITTSIVVPAYNEERGLAVVLQAIFSAVNGAHEVIVVDDGSNDATAEVASKFPCRVIKHEENRGKGHALKTGVYHAVGKNVIFIDADNTYPAEAIPQMCEALESCDIVYASRATGRNNIPRFNRVGNLMFQKMIRGIYGFKGSDYSTGLYGIRKHLLERMEVSSPGFSIEPEIAIKASRMKLLAYDIPIEYRPRVGKAKLSGPRGGFEHLKTIVGHMFWRPS
ncbi:MAG: glycosyltransferase family 2 protein [Dehalococcoidia bacterium]